MKDHPYILVAYKKSRYEHFVEDEQDPVIVQLLKDNHVSVQSLLTSHHTHTASLDSIRFYLDRHDLQYDCLYRADVHDTKKYDLIISVGGDGTVLDLSHHILDTPILAINSDPDSSIGYFTAGTAAEFPELLERTLNEQWLPFELTRFNVLINDRQIHHPVLNDVLICHANPAAVSNYFIITGQEHAEEQKSSGIWISTAAGSTAAIASAGGQVMPFHSTSIQYLVREPYHQPHRPYRFLRGIQPLSTGLRFISKMREGCVFLDGPHIKYPFNFGDQVSIEAGASPLTIYGLADRRRMG